MAVEVRVSLAIGVSARDADDGVRLSGRSAELSIPQPSAAVRSAVGALAEGTTEAALVELAGRDALGLFYQLELAAERGLLQWTVLQDGQPLLSLFAVSLPFARRPAKTDDERVVVLSRFASLSADQGAFSLECPLSCGALRVHDARAAALLFEMATPRRLGDLAARSADLNPAAVRCAVRLIAEAAMIEPDASAGEIDEAAALAARQWEPHDLAFHARTRHPRLGARSGGTYRFEGEIAPLPAVKAQGRGASIALPRPDLEALRLADRPFTEVLERRRSLRSGRAPLDARDLGGLLYRSARVRRVDPSPRGELSDRPYPGAGAVYELEIYPVVARCEGLAAGLYHYCPAQHRLETIAGETAEVRAMLAAAVAQTSPPDVVLVLAARFQRVAYKYESIAYSLVLKDVGALIQTMHLVATAMDLALCALGRGDARLFCKAAGTDPYVEGSVGEIALFGRA